MLVSSNEWLDSHHVLLKLEPQTPDTVLPEIKAGQFVQVRVDRSPKTFLRRPISINYVDKTKQKLWLLVQVKGEGTQTLSQLGKGETINLVYPLGNGFTMPQKGDHPLLVGGGVGLAPMLLLGSEMKENGIEPTFLLGARTASGILERDMFEALGRVFVTTEDASDGERGFVTQHSILQKEPFNKIFVCGPTPMMKSVARYAKEVNADCEVSLENMMACGLGACLCCVEKTVKGNICVCKEGPVFNINQLLWQI